MSAQDLRIYNGQALAVREIPRLPFEAFRSLAQEETQGGARVVSFWGYPENGSLVLMMVLAHDKEGYLKPFSTVVKDRYASLTIEMPQVHWFEREIFEQWGTRPEGHPWLKPIRFHAPWKKAGGQLKAEDITPSDMNFLKISGEEIHEVAVGPVHAGIIEPGHFRFQCHGEQVFHLEISLGYQHRGIEKALMGGPDKRAIHYIETAAGDTTVGHTLAYCQAIEGLSGCEVPLRASMLRAIMLELERLANHTGDLGAMAGDVGYLPTSSYCGRLRGDFLNLTALICGNRFGRTMIRPGGVLFDVDDALIQELKRRLVRIFAEVKNAVSLIWDSSLVIDRFDETGVVEPKTAVDLGLVGVAARACGIERDVRFDFPTGAFQFSQVPVSTCVSGDVFGRAFVRWLEMQKSVDFILDQLNNLPAGKIRGVVPPVRHDHMVVSLVEGWRGEICHTALSGRDGSFARYKIVDPSFHNWIGLAMAMRGEEISDFPLCNKSFNLSYCGHDL
ncbi:MAG TPA: NADH-quinone oxidoreductase subunit C [Candidatus Omnitrophota bacterium]|nr:NADH-quinone oxidoreductase subunit C [Candidatus Omnitrophota bacterium]